MTIVADTHPTVDPIITRNFEQLPNYAEAKGLLDTILGMRCQRTPRRLDRPLAIYGGGDLGRMASSWCKLVGIHLGLVIDAQPESLKEDPFWHGVRVCASNAISKYDRENYTIALCVAKNPIAPIEADLLSAGWRDIVPFYDIAEAYRVHNPLSNGWFAGILSDADREGIKSVLEVWQDDISRAHHLQFIAWRCLREEWSFDDASVTSADRFFIAPLKQALDHSERFLDLGAHRGESLLNFITKTAGRFDRITAIEPDPFSHNALLQGLSGLPRALYQKVEVLQIGVSEVSGRQRFAAGHGYASQISPLGSHEIDAFAIDDLELSPTLIKFHLEGHEWPALRGARETLLCHRPILAVTIYHNRDGLFLTAEWMMKTLPRYKFWMRTHSWCGTGAVIYAVPEERTA